MLENMEDTGPQLSGGDLDKLEVRLGYKMPDDFRRFLLKYNGGMPFPYYYDVQGWQEPHAAVNEFNGILPGLYNDIEVNLENRKGRLPEGFIPIANDPGGNTLLLSLVDETLGKVYFWDHENEPYERGVALKDYPNIYWVADSFNQLLEQLHEI